MSLLFSTNGGGGRKPKFYLDPARTVLIQHAKEWPYLGVEFSNYLDPRDSSFPGRRPYSSFVTRILKSAEKTLGACKLLGYRGDGLAPTTTLKLYISLVRPFLEICAQIVTLSTTQLDDLEKFQAKALRSLLGGLQNSVPRPVARLLAGITPLEARRDLLKIRYFLKLESNPPGQLVAAFHSHHKLLGLPFGFS